MLNKSLFGNDGQELWRNLILAIEIEPKILSALLQCIFLSVEIDWEKNPEMVLHPYYSNFDLKLVYGAFAPSRVDH